MQKMKYEILKSVGEGAYGTVYKCKNIETGETVAVKQFKDCEEDKVLKRTTLREVKILRMLRHENIVQLKEAFRRRDRLYLVFEFVDMNLLEVLSSLYPEGFGKKLVRETMWQLVRALDFCHRHDVMHRDIKPENLLMNMSDLRVKLCDFGFARIVPTSRDQELTDYVATRWYRAPELLLGCPDYGPSVDMFAIGCIMGEIIDGQPLLPGESELDQLCLIQLTIAPLRKDQLYFFNSNPRFTGMTIPTRPMSAQTICRLNDRFIAKETHAGLAFMRSLLEVHDARRLTAEEALRDKYFAKMTSPSKALSAKESHRNQSRGRILSPFGDRSCFPSNSGQASQRCSFASLSLKRN